MNRQQRRATEKHEMTDYELTRRVNDLRAEGKTYKQIAEILDIPYAEVRRRVYRPPNGKPSPEVVITERHTEAYKRQLKVGQKVTIIDDRVEEGYGLNVRQHKWTTAKITAKYPNIVTLDNGHSATYRELVVAEYQKRMEGRK